MPLIAVQEVLDLLLELKTDTTAAVSIPKGAEAVTSNMMMDVAIVTETSKFSRADSIKATLNQTALERAAWAKAIFQVCR